MPADAADGHEGRFSRCTFLTFEFWHTECGRGVNRIVRSRKICQDHSHGLRVLETVFNLKDLGLTLRRRFEDGKGRT